MLKIINLKKLKERPFYDSWWLVETNEGSIKLHQYDGVNCDELMKELNMCSTINEINDLTPKHFYFD